MESPTNSNLSSNQNFTLWSGIDSANDTVFINTKDDYDNDNRKFYNSNEICECNGTKDAPQNTIVAEVYFQILLNETGKQIAKAT